MHDVKRGGGRPKRRRLTAPALLALASLGVTPAGAEAAGSLFDSPFHPLLCETAIAAAQRGRDWGLQADCDMVLLADGLFCRGMQDDPIALRAAVRLLEQRRHAAPMDVRARLQLAAAVQRLEPRSGRVIALLREARERLDGADLGAAAPEIADRIAHALAELDTAAATPGALPADRATLAGAAGDAGVPIEATPDAATLGAWSDDPLGSRSAYEQLRRSHRAAVARLCRRPGPACTVARRRLDQAEWLPRNAPCALPGGSAQKGGLR